MKTRKEVFIIKNIAFQVDEEFHKEIKIRSTREGKTIKDYIIQLIQEDLKKGEQNGSAGDSKNQ